MSHSNNHAILISTTLGLISLTSFFASTSAQAAVLNGGFETGDFTSWNTIGGTSIQTSSYGSSPTGGTFQALASADVASVTPADPAALESFLGLTSGRLDTVVNSVIFGGSAIKQSFSANAGDVVSFNWNFLTNEVPNSANNNFAFVTINGRFYQKLADQSSTLVTSNTPFVNETGFKTFSNFNVPTTGTYILGIGVANVGDGFSSSGILVDNVSAQSVPVPFEFMPSLGVGILGGAWLVRKAFKQEAYKIV